ncbi:prolyl 4-hydroxylase subunit alpha-2-like isoform X2 [Homalodisca vitripennis]|uniref:prolyl 4-hydroxylase subunit alpha-2-like isoform X2 n=1 Tax=Homalodisca vitripennis TaxID=197043 RepID=UPI001EE9FBBD|nr:prolyl 4-hydroxylase subunit alpha-2-like isoform X2 [Homalodisca vitripennis]
MKIIVCIALTSLILFRILEARISHNHKRLMKLFESEQRLLNKLQEHIQRLETVFKPLERQMEEILAAVPRQILREQYLRHPLNNIALIKRLVIDWKNITQAAANMSMPSTDVTLPGRDDLRAVMRSLVRLQQAYQLKTEHLAQGFVQGDQADVHVTGKDCLLIAILYCQLEETWLASQWLKQALVKHDSTVYSADLLEINVLLDCLSGDMPGLVYTLMEHFPGFESSRPLLDTWKVMHEKKVVNLRQQYEVDEGDLDRLELCRVVTGSNLQPQHVLSCRYVHYNKTRLRLGPFRVEELQLDPPVLLFHNIINDAEIREVQRCAHSRKLKTSNVTEGSGLYVTYDRSSEMAVIPPGASSVFDRLDQRMGDMSNLVTSTSERTQVTRFGVGGECLFHHDFRRSGFLNDVARGGHTVFEHWGLSFRPQKGAALFWFNILRNGMPDHSTEHGDCPVLTGSKWILKKWFRELNNDVTKYCMVDPQTSFKYFYV